MHANAQCKQQKHRRSWPIWPCMVPFRRDGVAARTLRLGPPARARGTWSVRLHRETSRRVQCGLYVSVCLCLCPCVSSVSVICDMDYGSQGSDTRYSYHQISFLIFEIVLSLSEAKVERNNALCSLQKYCAERGLGPKMWDITSNLVRSSRDQPLTPIAVIYMVYVSLSLRILAEAVCCTLAVV